VNRGYFIAFEGGEGSGKSTLLAALLSADSLLVSNEVIRSRLSALRENMERWGYANGAIAGEEAEVWGRLPDFFDVIVTDVPCSGEGMFRKLSTAVSEWSPAHVRFCAARQKKILAPVVQALAPGGVLIYSTCTYNAQENEENVAWLTQDFGLEPVALDIPAAWGIVGSGTTGYHFYPHRTRGEGFFIAVLRKTGSAQPPARKVPAGFKNLRPLHAALVPLLTPWFREGQQFSFFQMLSGEILALPTVSVEDYLTLDKVLAAKWFGVVAGQIKGNSLAPAHALSLSLDLHEQMPVLPLSLQEALLFLRKETFPKPEQAPPGWTLATYRGLPLGWMKVLPDRLNNYLPADRRILMAAT
jgi:NOL1/NOP2/fmu family ribosome biogenesis protein